MEYENILDDNQIIVCNTAIKNEILKQKTYSFLLKRSRRFARRAFERFS